MGSIQACLLLGSNIEAQKNLPKAVGLLSKELVILRTSSVWQSKAVGSDGPDFLNTALLVETTLGVNELKGRVARKVEEELKRVRTEDKNAPRTIDIDIIFYDGKQIDDELDRYEHILLPVSEVMNQVERPSEVTLEKVALNLWRKR